MGDEYVCQCCDAIRFLSAKETIDQELDARNQSDVNDAHLAGHYYNSHIKLDYKLMNELKRTDSKLFAANKIYKELLDELLKPATINDSVAAIDEYRDNYRWDVNRD
jgi:hypothetical protein